MSCEIKKNTRDKTNNTVEFGNQNHEHDHQVVSLLGFHFLTGDGKASPVK